MLLWAHIRCGLVHAADTLVTSESARRFPQMRQVHAITQDAHGFLWLGTEAGLWNFDGTHFQSVSAPRFGAVVALAVDGVGNVWLAKRKDLDGAVYRLSKGLLAEQPDFARVTGAEIEDLRVDGRDRVWVRSKRGLFVKAEGDAVVQVGPSQGLKGDVVTALMVHGKSVWAATNAGVFATQDTQFVQKADDVDITAMCLDNTQRLWLAHGASQPRLAYLERGARQALPASPDVDLPRVTSLAPFDGGLVATSVYGFWWTDGKEVKPFAFPDVGRDVNAWSAFVDRDQNLWVGTDFDGLLQVRRQPLVRTKSVASLGHGSAVFALAKDKTGAVWASLPQGPARSSAQGWEVFPIPAALRVFTPRSLSIGTHGELWIGTMNEGVVRLVNGEFTHFTAPSDLPSNAMPNLFHTREGALYVGQAGGGLLTFSDGKFTEIKGSRQVCSATVASFDQAADGALWFATAGAGLCRYDGTGIEAWTTKEGLPENDLRALYVDNHNVIWIGTNQLGLAVKRSDKIEAVPLDLDLNLEEVASIIGDNEGNIWLSTPIGLFRINAADVFDVLDGKRASIRSLKIGMEDGLLSGTFLGQWTASALRTAEGSLWFPNFRGLVQVPSPKIATTQNLPKPHVDLFLINGKPLDPSQTLEVPVGGGNVEVAFSAAEFMYPHRLQFSHKLIGQEYKVDERWRATGEKRSIFYANLAPGHYEMHIVVGTTDRDDKQSAVVRFRLVPPLYRTTPFYLGCVTMFALLLYAFYRLRMWQVRDRFNAVMSDRGRIARDMHDTLEQGLIAMKLQTESLLKNAHNHDEVTSRAARIQSLIGESLRDAKSSVWALRAEASGNTDLATALSVSVGWLLRGTEVKFESELKGKACRLEPEAQQQIVRIIQEALNNAVKHGQCRSVKLVLDFSQADVRVALSDDGRGFDNAAGPAEGHFGLLGMRERADQVGVKLAIDSESGVGTKILIVVPKRLRRATLAQDSE